MLFSIRICQTNCAKFFFVAGFFFFFFFTSGGIFLFWEIALSEKKKKKRKKNGYWGSLLYPARTALKFGKEKYSICCSESAFYWISSDIPKPGQAKHIEHLPPQQQHQRTTLCWDPPLEFSSYFVEYWVGAGWAPGRSWQVSLELQILAVVGQCDAEHGDWEQSPPLLFLPFIPRQDKEKRRNSL